MSLVESVLDELREDYVGVWELFREAHLLQADEDVKGVVLEAVNQLLNRGDVQFGDFDGDNFVPSSLAPETILRDMGKALLAIGRDPDIGEIGWFRLTESQQ